MSVIISSASDKLPSSSSSPNSDQELTLLIDSSALWWYEMSSLELSELSWFKLSSELSKLLNIELENESSKQHLTSWSEEL